MILLFPMTLIKLQLGRPLLHIILIDQSLTPAAHGWTAVTKARPLTGGLSLLTGDMRPIGMRCDTGEVHLRIDSSDRRLICPIFTFSFISP